MIPILATLKHIINHAKPGTSIYDLCVRGDLYIGELLSKVYNKKRFIKGVAFPTSIAVNEVCGNFVSSNEESNEAHEYKTLNEGDVAKIDLGVHIHGFSAVIAHTIVVSAKGEKSSGKKADVILAAYNALQAGLRLMYPTKNNNNEVTNAIKTVADAYKVAPVEGVLSHRMKRDIIDGVEVIINNQTFDQKVDQRNFEVGDVFGLDIILSTGEGKPRETTIKTNVYKRALETTYKLKIDSSRKLLSIVEQNFHTFPFSFSSFENEELLKMKNKIVILSLIVLEQRQTSRQNGTGRVRQERIASPLPCFVRKERRHRCSI